MAEIKFTKNELRLQQNRLMQLRKYLPTLQLKKAMLQAEVNEARAEITEQERQYREQKAAFENIVELLSEPIGFNPVEAVKIENVKKRYENIAGVEVPYFEGVTFAPFWYSLLDTPPWVDALLTKLKLLTESRIKVEIAIEKRTALEKELREVSIRVNLFEKILIPRALRNIKRIKVFLGDQQLAAVSQAKVAKAKLEEARA